MIIFLIHPLVDFFQLIHWWIGGLVDCEMIDGKEWLYVSTIGLNQTSCKLRIPITQSNPSSSNPNVSSQMQVIPNQQSMEEKSTSSINESPQSPKPNAIEGRYCVDNLF